MSNDKTHPVDGRRQFLLGAGAAGSAVVAQAAMPLAARADPAVVPAARSTSSAPSTPAVDTYLTLTPSEVAFLSAVADNFIPADELSLSGTDAGVVVFIDRQLAGAWGAGSKSYREGPFRKGLPTQGYQLQLTPRDFFREGILATNRWLKAVKGQDLDFLKPAEQVEALKTLEAGKAALDGVDGKQFFEALLTITMEGFFADPIYGGNRGKTAWKMVGYPGLPATYATLIGPYRNRRYLVEPKSIEDFS